MKKEIMNNQWVMLHWIGQIRDNPGRKQKKNNKNGRSIDENVNKFYINSKRECWTV